MKQQVSFTLFIALIIAAGSGFARSIDPIVSTEWLETNQTNVVIVDIRSTEAYEAGHISGAISEPWAVPFSAWITMPDSGLLLEMPAAEDLFAAIGALGISKYTKVVVVGAPNPGEPVHFGPAGVARVAMTLRYAGVRNVAILDGGHPKWVAENRSVDTLIPPVTPVEFTGCIDTSLIASIEDVSDSLYRATLIDARDADVYFGATIEPYAPVAGHIPSAASLPGPFAYNAEGDVVTFKDADELGAMAEGVVSDNWPFWVPVEYKKVIIYCGVGGYGSIWTYLMREVLGYRNVKLYDGSAQEWVAAEYPMTTYKWER
ncbi:MAG: sulfurtransferase [Deltaproteobacteria bacterium]|nr:sulfurtransferase [Deltaproteobacteria bacterium]